MTKAERIEAMARAYWERYAAHYYEECRLMPPWDALPDEMKGLAVSCMFAAYDAADVEGMASEAVRLVLEDLRDRSGIGNALEEIDDDVRAEMEATHAAIVRRVCG